CQFKIKSIKSLLEYSYSQRLSTKLELYFVLRSTITAEGKNVYFSVLEVGKVTVEDAEKYKVTAKNELGESNATISLNFDSDDANIPDEGVKPTFTDRPVIRQSDDGNKVIFECRLVADPTPIITWG
uniref:Ig-like domain-containing protein n=1 Tax=Strigamia maritima TaxID=126957 RepID=T1JKL2_STRMM